MSHETRRDLLRTAAAATLVYGCTGSTTAGKDTTDPTDMPDTSDTATGTDTPTTPTGSTADTGTPKVDCDPTSSDIEGPFWVDGVPVRNDLDLHGEKGPRLSFGGVVLDATTCAPIPNAVVELWHADTQGDYDGAADGRYRGQTATDAKGAYEFHTVVPGRYLNGQTFRPAHLHMKVWVDGKERLTTQLYFDNDPYNDADPWFDTERVVADLDDGDTLVGTFDFVV